MLRSCLFALLAANLLFFAWSRWIAVRSAPGASADVAAVVAATGTVAAETASAPGRAADGSGPPPAAPARPSLGPGGQDATAARAAALLAGAGKTSKVRVVETRVADGHWVYVGKLRDQAEQRRTLDVIKRAGIEDAYAMPDDADFRVSVGIFSDRERAEQRARRVRGLQLDAQIEDHLRTRSEDWLDFAAVTAAALQPAQLAPLGIVDATLVTADCPLSGHP